MALARLKEPDLAGRFRALGIDAVPIDAPDAPFDIWVINLPVSLPAAAWSLLSEAEQARAMRFHTDRLRRRYTAAHTALRVVCERQFGIPAAEQRFEIGDHGKPTLSGVTGAQCNISYSGDRAIVAAAWGRPIGVDIEQLRAIDDADDLMVDLYTAREIEAVRRAGRWGADRDTAFLRVWVRKEACVKALGEGLSIPLKTVACGVTDRTTTVRFQNFLIRTGVAQYSDHDVSSADNFLLAWAQLDLNP